ncbi:unnamed protein product, partial [Mesorhabditis belari]|uniref:Uncharacterized protein n=1 Tax=Mesorhabditis belari TaxID=2138241 RepID=A0AAF3FG14_9BILA
MSKLTGVGTCRLKDGTVVASGSSSPDKGISGSSLLTQSHNLVVPDFQRIYDGEIQKQLDELTLKERDLRRRLQLYSQQIPTSQQFGQFGGNYAIAPSQISTSSFFLQPTARGFVQQNPIFTTNPISRPTFIPETKATNSQELQMKLRRIFPGQEFRPEALKNFELWSKNWNSPYKKTFPIRVIPKGRLVQGVRPTTPKPKLRQGILITGSPRKSLKKSVKTKPSTNDRFPIPPPLKIDEKAALRKMKRSRKRMTEQGCFCPFLWDKPQRGAQNDRRTVMSPSKRSLRRFELIHEGVAGDRGIAPAHSIRRRTGLKRDYTPEVGYESVPIRAPIPPVETTSINPYIPPNPPLALAPPKSDAKIPASNVHSNSGHSGNDNMPSAVPNPSPGNGPIEVEAADSENPDGFDVEVDGDRDENMEEPDEEFESEPESAGSSESGGRNGESRAKSKVAHHQKPILPPPPQQPLVWMPETGGAYKPQLGKAGTDGEEDEDRTVIIEVPNGAPQPDHYLPPPAGPAGKVSELPARFNFILPEEDTPENPQGTVPKNPALLAKGSLKPKQSKVYDIVVSDGKGTPSPRTTTTTTTEPPFEVAPPFLGDPQLLSAVTGLLSAGALLPALGLADGSPQSFGGTGGLGGLGMGGGYPQTPYGRPLAYLPQGGGGAVPAGGAGFTEVTGQTKGGFTVKGAGGINNSGVSGFFVPEDNGEEQRRSSNSELVIGGPAIEAGSAGSINGETIAEVNPGSFPGSRITSLGEAWGGINPFQWEHGQGTPIPQIPT